MKDLKSNFGGQFRHPDIVVSMPSGPESGAKSIMAYFAGEVRQGVVFKPGETVQMGWMMLMLKATENGELDVWEPQFGVVPIVWERGASKTYRQLIAQKSVAEQLGVEPSFPSFRQSAVISSDFIESKNFAMSRDRPAGTDSGWLFTTMENGSSDGRLASLFEIASKRPEVIPFLALPAASAVVLNNGNFQVSYDGKSIDSDSNVVLRRLIGSDLTCGGLD